ncbi:MAG: Crp/Fnr family transcriptional regulator, partial [Spirochaetales bacterium]|nr:Crp/Fnr family transcriptional regulator [Spirochaetales bacterium]
DIPIDEQQKFEKKLSGLYLEKGEYLLREGKPPHKVSFVVSGLFRAYYLTESGDEKTIAFRGRGKPLSAYSSFLNGEPAKFSIQALEKSLLLFITIEDFNTLCSENILWKNITNQYYVNLFIEKEARERELMSDDAEKRYNRFVKDYPGLFERINHYYIASYLGISNVTLSRIRNKTESK